MWVVLGRKAFGLCTGDLSFGRCYLISLFSHLPSEVKRHCCDSPVALHLVGSIFYIMGQILRCVP